MNAPPSAETHLAVVADRQAGLTWEQLSAKYSRSIGWARYHCRNVILPRDERKQVVKRTPEYDVKWLQRVLGNTKADENGCWIWQGDQTSNGYGQTNYSTGTRILHREVYRVVTGRMPERWQYVCHSCDVKLCINPAHLWLGTPKDNAQDMVTKGRHAELRVTHCPRGHEYGGENTYVSKRGNRNCKICTRIRGRLKAGWPLELAKTLGITPKGHRPVGGKFPRKSVVRP